MIEAGAILLGFVLVLMALAAWLDLRMAAWVAQRAAPLGIVAALATAARLLRQQPLVTEHPDALDWRLAPVLYLSLALGGTALVPLDAGRALVSSEVDVVLWGALESLAVVVVFLHGWSANAPLPLIGAYRYVAIGLPAMLLSMFVLIAAALPAQSLSIGAIVEAQRPLWNVVRHPLGLPLFMLLGLSITLRGPFNTGDSSDLAGGTLADVAGAPRALWQAARLAMLASFALMASAVFLGGYLGPVLPGPLWLLLKAGLLLVAMVAASHLLARPPPARALTWLWVLLMPLGFLDLAIAGLIALP